MYPEMVIGTLHLRTYWLCVHLSFFAMAFYAYYAGAYLEKIPKIKVLLFVVLMFLIQYVGGGVAGYYYRWIEGGVPPLYVSVATAGRYFHSVLFTSLIFFIFYIWMLKRPISRFLDYFAVGACLMSGIGRIGCFLQGCCTGKPTDSFLGFTFPGSAGPVYPTQLYHLIFEMFLLLPFLFWFQKRKKFDGEVFWAFLTIYSVFRFGIEFLGTNPIALTGLTHAQIVSLILFVVAGFFWLRGRKAIL